MKLTGYVVFPGGEPVELAPVEVIAYVEGQLKSMGSGKVTRGVLEASADLSAVWGLLIDNQPVVHFAQAVDPELIDVGELVLWPDGVDWKAFHAPQGRVFGGPRAVERTPRADVPPAAQPRMTFATMVGNAAQQLSGTLATHKTFALAGASVTLKGVPTATEDAIGLEFPTRELAEKGIGLSEVSFSLKPKQATVVSEPPPQPSGPRVPDLGGYTRELAVRKLSAAGYIADVSSEIVAEPARVGRVLRQLPAAQAAHPTGGLVRLYVGKQGGS